MSPAARPEVHRSRLVLGLGIALAAGGVALLLKVLLFGAGRLPPTSPDSRHPGRPPVADVRSLTADLTRDASLPRCRSVLQQLNTHPDRQPPSLTRADEALLKDRFGVRDDEIGEVASPAFTLLDAHYLESCFLLRDAARSLDVDSLPDRVRARAAFAWVMRQVRLREGDPDIAPVAQVLRRGSGSPLERALVFLALLEQLDVPGCLVVVPDGAGKRPWLAGALIDGEIALFEPWLGAPVPGVGGQEIATLSQVRSRAEVVQSLRIDREYEVTFDQARQAQPCLVVSHSALAPRMRLLQEWLGPGGGARVAIDAAGLEAKFRQALAGAVPADATSPTRILRAFLLPEEGGIDGRPQDAAEHWRPRAWKFREALVDWNRLPRPIQGLEESVDRGRLRGAYARAFSDFYLGPASPRELLLRGRMDDAAAALVAALDQWRDQRQVLRSDPELEASVASWCQATRKAQGEFLIAAGVNPPTSETAAALDAARLQLEQQWSGGKIEPVARLIRGAAAESLGAEAAYLLALCKHEQAERGQQLFERKSPAAPAAAAREKAWRAAAERWARYQEDYPASRGELGALLLRCRALEALAEGPAATALLENVPARWNVRDRYVCLFRARLLRK